MAKLNDNENLDLDLDALGLGENGDDELKKADSTKDVNKKDTSLPVNSDPVEEGKKKADEALKNAAATAAIKAAVDANNEMAVREAEKTYIVEKKKAMLNRCKSDKVVKFKGNKLLANYFGTTYTFLYNTVPVTVKFDGTEQELPEFVYNRLMEKINEVADSNTNKIEIEDRTK